MAANKRGLKTEYFHIKNKPIRSGVYEVRLWSYVLGKYTPDYWAYFDVDTGLWYIACSYYHVAQSFHANGTVSNILNADDVMHKWRGVLDDAFVD